MEVTTFRDLGNKIGLSDKEYNQSFGKMERQILNSSESESFSFTELQLEAFNNEQFWGTSDDDAPTHIIVQGATSSGKTLISEVAIEECLKNNKKAIILVPLKAMVRERYNRFVNDFPEDKRVYASSSDYKDYDASIIDGKFDVAVIVYEKFFAIMSQKANTFLDHCGLLVVDEFQMLNSRHRGPKLEVSIQKVLNYNADNENHKDTYVRIMCLTTCDCKINHVKKWLTINQREPVVIASSSRPVGLEEYVIQLNGDMHGRYTEGERDAQMRHDPFLEYTSVEVDGYNPVEQIYLSKNRLLISLLKNIYKENRDAKVLIFVADKKSTQSITREILSNGILSQETGTGKIFEELEKYHYDEAYSVVEDLAKYRIAFHNSSLSTTMREFIEKYFSGVDVAPSDRLKCVVATETLTTGLNMPVDVMIIYDYIVPRGNEDKQPLKPQEYKNYVGRAGRLGQTRNIGRSYIFATSKADAQILYDTYLNCTMTEIASGMSDTEKGQAPYYLSLIPDKYNDIGGLAGRDVQLKDLIKLRQQSFSYICTRRSPVNEKGDAKKFLDDMTYLLYARELCRVYELHESDEDSVKSERFKTVFKSTGEDGVYTAYRLTDIGKSLAPYALDIDTCSLLNQVVRKQGKYITANQTSRIHKGGGFPPDLNPDDIRSNKYLLDILFVVCRMPEIRNSMQFKMPTDNAARERTQKAIERCLSMIYHQKEVDSQEKIEFWENSYIKSLFVDENADPQTEDYEALERTIILWYWTQGISVNEIRKELPIGSISTGDISRLAENAGYILEAASSLISLGTHHRFGSITDSRGSNTSLSAALYALSTEVYYGMPRKLVIIANRHLYGLHRDIILRVGTLAQKYGYDTPVEYLRRATARELENNITDDQRNELLNRIDAMNYHDDIAALLKTLSNLTDFTVSEEEKDAIANIVEQKTLQDLSVLDKLFWSTSTYDKNNKYSDKSKFFRGSDVIMEVLDPNVVKLQFESGIVVIGLYAHNKLNILNNLFRDDSINILLLNDDNIDFQTERGGNEKYRFINTSNRDRVDNVNTMMKCKAFAYLLAQTIANSCRDGSLLYEFFKDYAKAEFAPSGLNRVNYLLKNYTEEREFIVNGNKEPVNLICDYQNIRFFNELKIELRKQNISYRKLYWGTHLRDLAERKPQGKYLLILTHESKSISKSVGKFCQYLKQRNNAQTCAIFPNKTERDNWMGDPAVPDQTLYSVYEGTYREKIESVKKFFSQHAKKTAPNPLIGVSYAHNRSLNDSEQPRYAAELLDKIISKLNDHFGEDKILYDRNEYYRRYFSGNNARKKTLELYQQCKYWIVLNDEFYTVGDNCPAEYEAIQSIARQPENNNRVKILIYENGSAGDLLDRELDYPENLPRTDEDIENWSQRLIREIEGSD